MSYITIDVEVEDILDKINEKDILKYCTKNNIFDNSTFDDSELINVLKNLQNYGSEYEELKKQIINKFKNY